MKKILLVLATVLYGCGIHSHDYPSSVQEVRTGIDENARTIVLDDETFFNTLVMMLAFPDKYEGYEVTLYGMVDKIRYLGDDGFCLGRMVVTCSLEDAEFMGLVCLCDDAEDYAFGDWVSVQGTLHCTDNNVPYLVDTSVERKEPPADVYIYTE